MMIKTLPAGHRNQFYTIEIIYPTQALYFLRGFLDILFTYLFI